MDNPAVRGDSHNSSFRNKEKEKGNPLALPIQSGRFFAEIILSLRLAKASQVDSTDFFCQEIFTNTFLRWLNQVVT